MCRRLLLVSDQYDVCSEHILVESRASACSGSVVCQLFPTQEHALQLVLVSIFRSHYFLTDRCLLWAVVMFSFSSSCSRGLGAYFDGGVSRFAFVDGDTYDNNTAIADQNVLGGMSLLTCFFSPSRCCFIPRHFVVCLACVAFMCNFLGLESPFDHFLWCFLPHSVQPIIECVNSQALDRMILPADSICLPLHILGLSLQSESTSIVTRSSGITHCSNGFSQCPLSANLIYWFCSDCW